MCETQLKNRIINKRCTSVQHSKTITVIKKYSVKFFSV